MKLVSVFLCLFVVNAMTQFWDGIRTFSAAVYKRKCVGDSDNFLVSPLSAELVLALASLGADGETQQQIQRVLHLPEGTERVKEVCKMAVRSLESGEDYILHTANKVCVDSSLSIKNQFKKTANEVFKSAVENFDFKNRNSVDMINRWVEQHTENKIHNLLSRDSLNSQALVLVNALYFKGKWLKPFNKDETTPQKFYKSDRVVEVDTMCKKGTFAYFQSSRLDAKFLEMRFRGKDASMIVALPNKNDGLENLEKRIDEVIAGDHVFSRETVLVCLPKFKIETSTFFTDILQNVGVVKAFSNGEADFSGVAGSKGDLWMGEVIQKAYIDVDEEGAEAAAATVVGMPRMLPLNEPEPEEFIADHPFIFYIQVKNMVLFVGRVTDPNYS